MAFSRDGCQMALAHMAVPTKHQILRLSDAAPVWYAT